MGCRGLVAFRVLAPEWARQVSAPCSALSNIACERCDIAAFRLDCPADTVIALPQDLLLRSAHAFEDAEYKDAFRPVLRSSLHSGTHTQTHLGT